MTTSQLEHLSELAGILPEYHDIWGACHKTSDKTRRGLLAAMDIHAGTDAATKTAIRSWQQRHWHQPLPAVQVAQSGQAISVLLRLPAHAMEQPHRWRMSLESGETRECLFVPLGLPKVDREERNGEPMLAFDLNLPALGSEGYHRLELWLKDELLGEMPLIICPTRCYHPPAIEGARRVWGLALQLYGVRSLHNWGIGDYADLHRAVEWAAEAGASLVGVNPLHALFHHNPRHCSPYSPSSRQFFNVLHISIDALPELQECQEAAAKIRSPAFQAQLQALRAAPLVDYAEVGRAKYGILETLYRHFRSHHLANNTPRAEGFQAFQSRGGDDLYHFALYHALQAHFYQQEGGLWGWPVWPEAYRDPASPEVHAFAAANAEAIEYQQWLQWLADQQLAAVGQRSFELGLGVGLYQDLAVGVDKGSAETWINRDLYAMDAKVGCPPDEFNPLGQDWGLPPWIPQRLRQAAYAPFIAMLRANMQYAGALRIDHVMSLMRLYWVPPGQPGNEGAYVAYPLQDLLGILALESQRNRCLVVGEDLGTVPGEVREALHDLGVLSYRLFYFERGHDGSFQPPGHYPEQALVAATTHDLATLTGFWRGVDIDTRTQLGLYPSEELRSSQIIGRADDRARMLQALEREELLPAGVGVDPVRVPEMPPVLLRAIHRYLARSPAKLVLVQAEDMLGEAEQANLPGTTDQHPNWRRKLSLNLEEWADDPRTRAMAEAIAEERGRAVSPPH
jgi:(1->4)-alpha-D-glucan 1-alpha-D-glucosylmutase